jgi:hypothetical protein
MAAHLPSFGSVRAQGGHSGRWKPVTLGHGIALSGGFLLLFWLLLTDPDGYIRVLDDANLLFHEAGHPIFGIFGPALGMYGGTLGQLAFPVITSVAFWRRRETISLAVTLAWFFENFMSIARYMADARAQDLPLVGGGQHDWQAIFTQWGMLNADTQIAGVVRALGWLGLLATWAWIAWRWHRDRQVAPSAGE